MLIINDITVNNNNKLAFDLYKISQTMQCFQLYVKRFILIHC